MGQLEMGKVYKWSLISATYPNMYAIITDVKEKGGLIQSCKLLEITTYENKEKVVHEYKNSDINFDCVRTTFSAPNMGALN
ncbi:MAG: hypothetical protein IJV15_08545 [Lachnospiraceae bacterium]|nr:hypothetical protein [Lachnospiraceae bacterium]MBR1597765.1 hypothetical protein [Lachnospiraceae bacterium]